MGLSRSVLCACVGVAVVIGSVLWILAPCGEVGVDPECWTGLTPGYCGCLRWTRCGGSRRTLASCLYSDGNYLTPARVGPCFEPACSATITLS